ncbi:MAG TPA: alpha/beta hydrolase [Bacillales bacterium]|nr:alpha/beta hydrolase [Bacillales bacterium]
MALTQKCIDLCGVKIYCEYSFVENRPPLLLIHGVAATLYTFNSLIPLLNEHFSIIAIDLPGFGRSEKPSSFIFSFQNYAKIVAACIDYFKLDHVNIVGHSMGGQIALYTTKMIPEKINKLVLISSSGYLKRANKAIIFCTFLPFFGYYVKHQVHKQEVKDVLKNVFYDHSLITENHVREFGRPLEEKGFYTSLLRLLRYREGDLSSEDLKTIDKPTLLLWGREDRVVSFRIGERLADDLPNAKLITYEKAGHLLTEERSQEVYQAILDFI